MKNHTFLLTITLFLFLISSLFSQDRTKTDELRNLAQEKGAEYLVKKAEAIKKASAMNMPVRKEKADGTIMELQYFIGDFPIYYETENINAAITSSTKQLWDGDIGGFDLNARRHLLGVWDGGKVRNTHIEFDGRVTQRDGASSLSDHSTHVAGTMVAKGQGHGVRGMSWEAFLDAYDYNSDESEMAAAAAAGLTVSNHSYGILLGWEYDYFDDGKWAWLGNTSISPTEDYQFGFYGSQTRYWDQIAFDAPYYLICRSAGNERNETGPGSGGEHWANINGSWQLNNVVREPDGGYDGFDCIQTDKVGKNILTVGAVNDVIDYTGPESVVMPDFSSWGMTDDGRVKPDITANGVSLKSTSSSGDNAYTTKSGTSMSTPNTSGSIGLLQDLWNDQYGYDTVRAATMKGLVIHTAKEAGPAPGPDYMFGWGLLNTYEAAWLLRMDSELGGSELVQQLYLGESQTIEIDLESNGNEPLKATICWTDHPGTPVGAQLNPPDIMLVNDLDLRIVSPTGTEHKPWILDPENPAAPAETGDNFRDNVEKVYVENPVAGTYKVKITHKNTLRDGYQAFSLVMSGRAMEQPDEPALVYPENGADGVELNFTMEWAHSVRSQSYSYQVALDDQFSQIVYENSSYVGVRLFMESLTGLTTYYWRVKAENNGGISDWSETRSFTTKLDVPQAPQLVYPADDEHLVPNDFDFEWTGDPTADYYQIQAATNLIFLNPLINKDSLTTKTWPVTGFEEGKRYFWRVFAYNQIGVSDYNSAVFYISLNTPDSLTAENTAEEGIKLTWKDNSAVENSYIIERKDGSGAEFSAIDTIAANMTEYYDTEILNNILYSYRVNCANSNTYSDFSPEATVLSVGIEDEKNLPGKYSLSANYPNPFNPSTTVNYNLPYESFVTINIFNVLGELVDVPVNNQTLSAGNYSFQWDGKALSSGLYFYKIVATSTDGKEKFTSTRKMILMK